MLTKIWRALLAMISLPLLFLMLLWAQSWVPQFHYAHAVLISAILAVLLSFRSRIADRTRLLLLAYASVAYVAYVGIVMIRG